MRYVVAERWPHARDVVTLTLRPVAPLATPLFRPGQFAVLGAHGPSTVANLISGRVDPGGLQFTLRADPAVDLSQAVCGTPVTVTEPFGAGWPVPAPAGADAVLPGQFIGPPDRDETAASRVHFPLPWGQDRRHCQR